MNADTEPTKQVPNWLGPVTCDDCQHIFPVDPVYLVYCPTCGAAPGTKCFRPSEHRAFGGSFHSDRDLAADDGGKYRHRCIPSAEARRNAARARRGSAFRMEIPR